MAHRIEALLFISLALPSAGCAGADAGPDADPAPPATTAAELHAGSLTATQEKTALKLIDDICGDTWCSGDYDFRFDALSCCAAAGTCTLSFEFLPREGVTSAQSEYHRSCRTKGFTGFASLVETAPNGYQSLDNDYYAALTDCISTLEAELPR